MRVHTCLLFSFSNSNTAQNGTTLKDFIKNSQHCETVKALQFLSENHFNVWSILTTVVIGRQSYICQNSTLSSQLVISRSVYVVPSTWPRSPPEGQSRLARKLTFCTCHCANCLPGFALLFWHDSFYSLPFSLSQCLIQCAETELP